MRSFAPGTEPPELAGQDSLFCLHTNQDLPNYLPPGIFHLFIYGPNPVRVAKNKLLRHRSVIIVGDAKLILRETPKPSYFKWPITYIGCDTRTILGNDIVINNCSERFVLAGCERRISSLRIEGGTVGDLSKWNCAEVIIDDTQTIPVKLSNSCNALSITDCDVGYTSAEQNAQLKELTVIESLNPTESEREFDLKHIKFVIMGNSQAKLKLRPTSLTMGFATNCSIDDSRLRFAKLSNLIHVKSLSGINLVFCGQQGQLSLDLIRDNWQHLLIEHKVKLTGQPPDADCKLKHVSANVRTFMHENNMDFLKHLSGRFGFTESETIPDTLLEQIGTRGISLFALEADFSNLTELLANSKFNASLLRIGKVFRLEVRYFQLGVPLYLQKKILGDNTTLRVCPSLAQAIQARDKHRFVFPDLGDRDVNLVVTSWVLGCYGYI